MTKPYTLAVCPECGGEGGWLTPFGDYGEECEMCEGLGTIKVAIVDPHIPMRKVTMRYVKFKAHKKGIPNLDGGAKTCMHCGKQATTSAVKKNGHLTMDVWFCDDHAAYAKEL